ncbi:MAG: DNA-protecting protein DprA, partial [Verrucomicrobia bacterium]|nr:DNA-protecting protein DprA [Verrucomicrobiota bacterium]
MRSAVEAYLALNLLPNVGPIRVRRLLGRFGSPQAILAASAGELRSVNGIGEEMAAHIAG